MAKKDDATRKVSAQALDDIRRTARDLKVKEEEVTERASEEVFSQLGLDPTEGGDDSLEPEVPPDPPSSAASRPGRPNAPTPAVKGGESPPMMADHPVREAARPSSGANIATAAGAGGDIEGPPSRGVGVAVAILTVVIIVTVIIGAFL